MPLPGHTTAGFVGKVGERLQLELTLERARAVKTNAGDFCRIYKFSDREGHRFSWISDSGPASWLEGKTFSLRGTVKRHTQFGRIQETDLTRVRLLHEVEKQDAMPVNLTEVTQVDAGTEEIRAPAIAHQTA